MTYLGQEKPDLDELADVLVHFGVKGMTWGHRKDHPEGVRRSTSRDARKDAHEFSRAKMFYGEGAGTRRKLINASVEAKSKRDPSYKKAFDHHLANQDMSKHAAKARGERKRKNVRNSAAKTTRGISHYLRGNHQYASAAAAMIAGGALWAHKNGVDKVVLKAGKTTLSSAMTYMKRNNIKPGMTASEFLKNF